MTVDRSMMPVYIVMGKIGVSAMPSTALRG